ncbi:NADP-dependent oxidoreductase domain-containing protein [Mycena vulgaris]|nr:NADP-dependent oxidoreductase domain-containing protein [Mycena vulgaris]
MPLRTTSLTYLRLLRMFPRLHGSVAYVAIRQRAYDIAKEKGYVLPTVCQAKCSAVARKQETELIPTLCKLNIAFYVYTAARRELGRRPLRVRLEAAKEAGCSRAELAYRWVAFDSVVDPKYGDAVIFGASKHSQISETLAWLKHGSVAEAAKAKIDELWKVVEHEAPIDNYNQQMDVSFFLLMVQKRIFVVFTSQTLLQRC